MEQQISVKAHEAIKNKVFPGCVVGYVKKSGERNILPYGRFTYEESAELVKEDTIYDLASITKSIPTACLALRLIDEKRLSLIDRLIDYVPEFANSDREAVLIKHLLTYTMGGYGLASLRLKTAADIFNVVFTRDFEERPGSIFKYSNIPAALLGLVLERVGGGTLDELADRDFFSPLKMHRTTFFPERFPIGEIPPTEIDDSETLIQGIVHDESARACKRDGKIVGHAGLFSTAGDLLTFLEMLLNKGMLNGKRYLSEDVVEQMGTNQIPELHDHTGLGWELDQPQWMGSRRTPHTFGKTGFTGTMVVCDVEKETAYIILSNRTYPKRPADSSANNAFRASIGEILL